MKFQSSYNTIYQVMFTSYKHFSNMEIKTVKQEIGQESWKTSSYS